MKKLTKQEEEILRKIPSPSYRRMKKEMFLEDIKFAKEFGWPRPVLSIEGD